nr:hypothetical protein [Tanacetum cinerariifolium]
KPKASARKKKGDYASSTTPPTPTPTTTVEQETHISQQSGSRTDEGTGSKPGVPDVPSDDLEEDLSWKSSCDEDEEGSFDPIPRTPEDSEKEIDDEEEQESRLSEEARIQEEEDADELY